jgi:hypothetical protein
LYLLRFVDRVENRLVQKETITMQTSDEENAVIWKNNIKLGGWGQEGGGRGKGGGGGKGGSNDPIIVCTYE